MALVCGNTTARFAEKSKNIIVESVLKDPNFGNLANLFLIKSSHAIYNSKEDIIPNHFRFQWYMEAKTEHHSKVNLVLSSNYF